MPPPVSPVKTSSPTAPSAPMGPTPPAPRVTIRENQDHSLQIGLLIDPDIAIRLRRKAGTMKLEMYLWENLFKAALVAHVY